jgi:hypothetical protein
MPLEFLLGHSDRKKSSSDEPRFATGAKVDGIHQYLQGLHLILSMSGVGTSEAKSRPNPAHK